MSMNVLINFSPHPGWFPAIQSLFGARLGYTVYSPDGSQGWKDLGIQQVPYQVADYEAPTYENSIECYLAKHHPFTLRMISVEQFHEMDFDIIVAGNKIVETSFYNLMRKYKPKSIFIREIANLLEKPKDCKNVLAAIKTPFNKDIKSFVYHPEHSKEFNYIPFKGPSNIKSFSNYLRSIKVDARIWDLAKGKLTEFDFKMHGVKTDDGFLSSCELPKIMKSSMFIWHTKPHGGCGFVARQALACGRPMIVNKNYCKTFKTLAQDYLQDGENCIDIAPGIRSMSENFELIKRWSQPDMYEKKCQDVVTSFEKRINFKEEAERIKKWLETLKPGV